MGKISVFKFNINNDEKIKNNVNDIINKYLISRGLLYDSENSCYTTRKPTKKEKDKNATISMGVSIAATILGGGYISAIIYSVQHAFEYKFTNDQLIIKAYLIDEYGFKSYIHSSFNNTKAGALYYSDLKHYLFKELENNNVILVSKEVEEVKEVIKIDDKEASRNRMQLIICFVLLSIPVFLFFLLWLYSTFLSGKR